MNAHLAAHVLWLAQRHDVEVHLVASFDNAAAVTSLFSREVHILPVVDDVTYVVALHELGHLLHPNGHVENDKLTSERAAWTWAEAHTIEWTPAMLATKLRYLGHHGGHVPDADGVVSYERGARIDEFYRQLARQAAFSPRPGGETISQFMHRRKRR